MLRTVLRSLAAEGNEWHLHDFDVSFLKRIVQGAASIDRLQGLPNGLMPVRYVALLRAQAQA